MDFKIGDLVTRKSHHNDLVFKIEDIDNDICYLKGVFVRLEADSMLSDLEYYEGDFKDDLEFEERLKPSNLNRDDYFYLPGKILHIDSDIDYLNRCLKYYEKMGLWAKGIKLDEDKIKLEIKNLIDEYAPNIVVITGHDAYYKKIGDKNDINAYKNSINFIEAIKEARKVEKSHDKLVIIAGACQSDYEELIKADANLTKNTDRINIYALDLDILA